MYWTLISEVEDPDRDSHGSASVFWFRIRIQYADPDPDPGGRFFLKLKCAREIASGCNFIKCFFFYKFLVSFFVMYFFFKLEKIFGFYLVVGPDPDPRSGRLLDLDPDPYK